jgi:tRNA pseudouridine55 synthase
VEGFRRRHAGPFRLKVMHGGVLDPFAEGLVLLLVGAATRLFERLHEVPKVYRATVAWGAETDTLDPGGVVVGAGDSAALSAEGLEAALRGMLGWQAQVPPATSNKRVGGVRAYVRAHRGEEVTLPPSRVYLHAARWRSHDLPRASELELVCGGGFYVRSLARDLGRVTGARAHLAALQRRAIGPHVDPPGEPVELTGREVLPWLSTRVLSDAEWGALRAGALLPPGRHQAPDWALPDGFPAPAALVRAWHGGRLVALLQQGRVHTLLPGGV